MQQSTCLALSKDKDSKDSITCDYDDDGALAAAAKRSEFLQQLPQDLRSLLMTMPRRYLPTKQFNELLQSLPHAISLEILDGLRMPALRKRGTLFFSLKNLLGRFKNETLQRRFVLVRRSLLLDRSCLLQWKCNTEDDEDGRRFRRELGFLLLNSRHLYVYHIFDGAIDTTRCKNLLREFCDKHSVHRHWLSTELHLHFEDQPNSLSQILAMFSGQFLSRVTRLSMSNNAGHIAQGIDITSFERLPALRRMLVEDSTLLDIVPASVLASLEHIDMEYFIFVEEDLETVLRTVEKATSLKPVTLCCTSDVWDQIRMHPVISQKLSQLSMMNALNQTIDNVSNLKGITLRYIGLPASLKVHKVTATNASIKALNENGQLSNLTIQQKGETKIGRYWLESLGIGCENCAVRTLSLRLPYCDLNMLVPILKCKHLETIQLTAAASGGKELLSQSARNEQIRAVLRFAVDQGLLLVHTDYHV